jgi:hypothetical protein
VRPDCGHRRELCFPVFSGSEGVATEEAVEHLKVGVGLCGTGDEHTDIALGLNVSQRVVHALMNMIPVHGDLLPEISD